jgi:transcription termination factor Rho
MSVGSPELDRSALERKERDELATIATALGEKPPARARKGEIVDLILRLTGVSGGASTANGADDNAEVAAKPKRTRKPKAKVEADDGPEGPPVDAPSDTPVVEATAVAVADTAARVAEGVTAGPEAAAPAVVEAGTAEPGDSSRPAEAAERVTDGAPTQAPRFTWDGDEALGGVAGGSGATADQATGDGGQQGSTGSQGQNGQRQGGQGGQRRDNQNRDNQNRDNQNRDNQNRDNQNRDNQNRGQGNQNRGNQGGQNQGNQQYDDGEPGNRRRRRRGRGGDRERGPAQAPEEVFQGEPVEVEGLLDLRDEGYGFLRLKGYLANKDDVYVSVKQARQFGLRKGDQLKGAARPASKNEKNPALLRIDLVNGEDPEKMKARPRFEDLTPLFPDERLKMESDDPTNMTARIVDLVCPIGKGQRGLIVSPPKAGKTTVMKQIAKSIEENSPGVHLMVLLVDERPEEVTDFRRSLTKGDVIASTFDRPSDEHTQVAELVIERAKRMVEEGLDVVIILDGITRLSRAYNLAAPATGRIMSGGIDTGALYPPKRFFGAARNVEEGGSLTILATALVETGSKMDEVIFEEFKGTGNMELKLDRKLAERRIYPAIDVDASSTRHEELLFERKQLQQAWRLRRVLTGLASDGGGGGAGLELLIDRMKTFKTNDEFLAEVAKAPVVG